jgi:MFS family permease
MSAGGIDSARTTAAMHQGDTLTPEERRRGMRYAYLGQATGTILLMLFIRTAFGTLFIKHLGGSDAAAMWVISIPGFAIFLQIPASLRIHPSRGRRVLLRCWAGFGLLMATATLMPSFIEDRQLALNMTLALIGCALVTSLWGGTFWFPLIHDVVPAAYRGRFFGGLRALSSTSLFVAVISAGLFLGRSPATWRFQLVILVGVGLVLCRNLFVARIPTPARPSSTRDDFRDWRGYLKNIATTPAIRTFAIYYALLGTCAGFLAHPLVLYMRDLGFPPRDNIVVFGFTTLGMVLALLAGGHVTDRLGTRRVFLIGHTVILTMLLSVILITSLSDPYVRPLLSIAFAVSGAALSVSGVACSTHLFHYAPERGRVFFLSLSGILLFLGPSLAALVAGTVLHQLGDTRLIPVLGRSINIFHILLTAAAMGALAAFTLLPQIENVYNRASD